MEDGVHMPKYVHFIFLENLTEAQSTDLSALDGSNSREKKSRPGSCGGWWRQF